MAIRIAQTIFQLPPYGPKRYQLAALPLTLKFACSVSGRPGMYTVVEISWESDMHLLDFQVLVFAMATQNNKEIFLSGLKKLFKEQWQPDVLLKAGNSDKGATISAHKLVLASRSVVLKKIMESDEFKASSKLETVTFSEMKHEELEALVEFMYCVDGCICLESLKKHVGSLYLAADKYDIPHLRDLCRKHLISSLNSSNALNTFELAQIPFDKALNDAAFTTIKNNISSIANSAEFKLFVVNNPYLSVEIMKAFLVQPNNYCCGYCGKYRY
ncbi:hypothetical protein F2Q70_00008680 [Brassica cretica]|uniref:BTB domain-containing protein n=1 Tax=Brassica cretica TaxID=69181 RepID=A0A8S9M3E1_BRACR|nr:hypothetical protein F2Q70_00008680 [Brassica cretica]